MYTVTTDTVSDAIDIIEVLKSIYYNNEFEFKQPEDEALYSTLVSAQDKVTSIRVISPCVECIIKAPLDTMSVVFHCSISLVDTADTLLLPHSDNLWLTREDHDSLVSHLKSSVDMDRASYVLDTIQLVLSLAEPLAHQYLIDKKQKETKQVEGPVVFLRDWIWFPMIYTREKRGHIVDWAHKYNVTGFLFPGKPGAMCLEGPEKEVNRFVHDIKTVSWADIPAAHRKMTSRWKESYTCSSPLELNTKRVFHTMTELKFDIHGAFSNHNNLNMLQQWLEEKGCEEAFHHLF